MGKRTFEGTTDIRSGSVVVGQGRNGVPMKASC
jgi:hypothetical protein